MKTKPASDRMYSLLVLYDMHTKFFAKAIEGISEEDAHKRLDTKANHAAWIAGSQVHQRADMAKEFGVEVKNETGKLFENYQGIKDDTKYPSMEEYKKEWEAISPAYREVLANITDEKLDSIFKIPDMPEMDMPYYDMISFMIYREANMIGQLALWRRLLGYDAIKYD